MRLQTSKSKVSTFGGFPRTMDLGGLGFNSRFGRCSFLCVMFPGPNGASITVTVVRRPGGLLQKEQVEGRRMETQTRNASVLAYFLNMFYNPIGLYV